MALPREFYEDLPTKTESELYEIITKPAVYLPEAAVSAKEELKRRHVAIPEEVLRREADALVQMAGNFAYSVANHPKEFAPDALEHVEKDLSSRNPMVSERITNIESEALEKKRELDELLKARRKESLTWPWVLLFLSYPLLFSVLLSIVSDMSTFGFFCFLLYGNVGWVVIGLGIYYKRKGYIGKLQQALGFSSLGFVLGMILLRLVS